MYVESAKLFQCCLESTCSMEQWDVFWSTQTSDATNCWSWCWAAQATVATRIRLVITFGEEKHRGRIGLKWLVCWAVGRTRLFRTISSVSLENYSSSTWAHDAKSQSKTCLWWLFNLQVRERRVLGVVLFMGWAFLFEREDKLEVKHRAVPKVQNYESKQHVQELFVPSQILLQFLLARNIIVIPSALVKVKQLWGGE